MMKILSIFVAFLENMNFKLKYYGKLQNRKILKLEGLVFTSRCVVLLPDPGDRNSLRHKKLFSARPKNVGIISISRTNIADENFEFHSLGRVFF